MPGDERPEFERLSTNVVPVNYNITLTPDLTNFVFDGEEKISVQITKTTSTITCHALDIKVKTVYFTPKGSSDKFEGSIKYGSAIEETVTFTFTTPLQAGEGDLCLTYSGELNNKMKGFYRSQYTTQDGQTAFNAVTHFEATDARRAFPCWDEPAVKAMFDITLVVPKDKVALSNMPEKSNTPHSSDKNVKIVSFETTPIMSTYLIAFTVGDYDYVEGFDKDQIRVRIYTPAGKKEQGRFALDVAVKTLPFYKDYFGIKYMLPKIDLLSVADFAIGAMENWGLLTFKEALILVDPKNTSAVSRQHVALVVGHELAHQWFGNLVTMDWWTDLWLKEGFATWIEYLCVDYCFPQWDIWTSFVNDNLIRALQLDSLHNSHPIEVKVGHPSEIDEIFDGISYSKGASIIRMLSDYLGAEDFRKGLNIYLSRHAYKNAETEDLWKALAESSGKPVKNVMDTWTKQMGYPVLEVAKFTEKFVTIY
ncbi:puromycin-sensitive aminopeptidase [Patella vulgata]|uniref:puromycin-sensitive aminopeptidase n=1 Tax=Patella vulgata TaxID=6465 RepID=UPI0024A8FE04|nr:puromycin-sensitive aminopeptidase [Patella vulgata]